jgi:nitrogen-specific signal transduction histidine kinase
MKIVDEFRHLEGFKGGIAVTESELMTTTTLREKQILTQVFYSNANEVVEQGQYIFDTFWKKAISADQKIREIEHGIKPELTEVISDTEESINRSLDIIASAKNEVLVIFATFRTFALAVNMDVAKIYRRAVENGAKIRLLIPDSERAEQIVNELKYTLPQICVRIADKNLQTKITILIADENEVMTWELKDDNIQDAYEAGGLATYSNNKSIASSYAAIFQSLWKQTELYEQLKVHDKMQKEFINIAAHELRTPIQPVLSLSEVLYSQLKDNVQQRQLLDAIIRNAKRLRRLTEDILDVSKIESRSLMLKREQVNVNHMILNIARDYENDVENTKLEVRVHKEDIFIEADRERLNQVISNLLNNAVKFTKEGIISIILEKKEGEAEGDNSSVVVISVKDTGTGIDPEIFPRLFSKFATKSQTGTGLGLFISKSIIEAHGGKIWAENNREGKPGATFSFTLPISK